MEQRVMGPEVVSDNFPRSQRNCKPTRFPKKKENNHIMVNKKGNTVQNRTNVTYQRSLITGISFNVEGREIFFLCFARHDVIDLIWGKSTCVPQKFKP